MEEKEVLILNTAIQEFAIKGYHQTKTDDIAAKAGVSKGLIFHYFSSKKKLYSQAVRASIRRLESVMNYTEFPMDSLVHLFDYSLKTKFKIAEIYESEMALVLDVYSNNIVLPKGLQEELTLYIENVTVKSYGIVTDIVKKMPIKDEFNKDLVVELILMLFQQVEQKAQSKMAHQQVTDLHIFDELIKETSQQIKILEEGFLRD